MELHLKVLLIIIWHRYPTFYLAGLPEGQLEQSLIHGQIIIAILLCSVMVVGDKVVLQGNAHRMIAMPD